MTSFVLNLKFEVGVLLKRMLRHMNLMMIVKWQQQRFKQDLEGQKHEKRSTK